jgi:hypothetical protein
MGCSIRRAELEQGCPGRDRDETQPRARAAGPVPRLRGPAAAPPTPTTKGDA